MKRTLLATTSIFLLAVTLGATPTVFSSVANAAHGAVADGNNGHGNNRNAEGSKADDVSNPTYDPANEDPTDGNSGIGDDKNGNNGRKGGDR